MSDRVLILRTCKREPDGRLTAHGGFVWPESGPVGAPDWSPQPACGGGLHGLLWGEGDGGLLSWEESAAWLVVAVDAASVVGLSGKVKFPRGEVVFCGGRKGATDYLLANGAAGKSVVGAAVVATGDMGTASATGDMGTASATGDMGTANATGDMGTANASGYMGTANASGDGGTANASGYGGAANAGPNGVIVLAWHDGERKRLVVSYVGEDGIEPGRAYRLDDSGKIVPAENGG